MSCRIVAAESNWCQCSATIRPDGDVIVDAHIADVWSHGDWGWPEDLPGVGGDDWLEVEMDCSWSLTARPFV